MQKTTERTRRRLLKTVGACAVVGTVASAGCIDGEPDEPPEADDGTDDEQEDEPEEVALDEPAEFPEDADCPVCNMVPADHPDWNAQVVHDDGERAYFCSIGCMVAYTAYPDEFALSESDIVGAWVTEYGTGELIDGMDAYYALETDSDRVDDTMMLNPAAFRNRDDAVAYVDEVDYISEDDVVGFEEFDAGLADRYRGQLTPGVEA